MHYSLAIFGNPVAHSISPQIHTAFARQFNLDVSYIKIKPALNKFREAVLNFKNNGGFGANITAPFKCEAFSLATIKTDRAMIAQSVNTFIFQGDTIVGDNTDGVGLLWDIKNNIGYTLTGKKILILGAGGAVRGILHPLLMEKPAEIIIANRTIENAQKLCEEFSHYGQLRAINFDQLTNDCVDVIIDGTGFDATISLSLSLSQNSLFYDLKYNAKNAVRSKWLAEKNCSAIFNGRGMVIEQAAEAFYLWTDKRPNAKKLNLR